MTGCTHNCDEGRTCTCRAPEPDALSYMVAVHVLDATPGLRVRSLARGGRQARRLFIAQDLSRACVARLRAAVAVFGGCIV